MSVFLVFVLNVHETTVVKNSSRTPVNDVIYRYAAACAWAALIGCMLPVLVALTLRYWLPVFYTVHVFVRLLRVKSV